MKSKMYLFAVCAAWSVVVCAESKATVSTKSVKPAGAVKVQASSNAIDAQKVLDDMKKRLDGNRKMLGSLKAEWQQKREALQKKLATSKAKNSAPHSGTNMIKSPVSSKVASLGVAPKKTTATAAVKKI